jgi:hypothetical protein
MVYGWESMNSLLVRPTIALSLAATIIGCGAPAAPQPPSLNLPTPVANLSAARVADSVHLAWTMPTRTTDHVALRHPVVVQVCRAVETGACTDIGQVNVAPGVAGSYVDKLPPGLTQGPDRLLRYEVALLNHAGKAAGPSNAAYSGAGPSPFALIGLTYQVREDGVLLNWHPEPNPEPSLLFRIERLQLTAGTEQAPSSPLAPVKPAVAQTLVVRAVHGIDPGHGVDTTALFNQQYRYQVERVATLALAGQSVEVQGPPSEAIVVTTTDHFPPAVPKGLVAVGDATAGSIDLSWAPDSDSDLAAYRVYRRDTHADLPAQRIASVGMETSFRDGGTQPGHTYAYSVSAIDQSGNESNRSAEVEETLPGR